MTRPTITDNNIRYGLFRPDAASSFTTADCLGKTYDTQAEANAALLNLQASLVHDLRSKIIVHEIDKTGQVENPSYILN
jgi:hypothetical protein